MTEKITLGQRKQLRILGQNAVENATSNSELDNLEKDKVQECIIANGDILQKRIEAETIKIILDMATPDKFANQEVSSKYGYLSGYKGVHAIEEQIASLKKYDWGRPIIGELNEKQKALLLKNPKGSEGWFAIPFNETMITDHDAGTFVDYGKPVEMVQVFIKKDRNGNFTSFREGKMGPRYYRRSKRLTKATRELWEIQDCPTDIILIPAQFGFTHRGRSVNRAREVIRGSQYPLGAYEILVMLLTHPERLMDYDDLWIDCLGDEYSNNGDGVFALSPYVDFNDGRVRFNDSDVSVASDYCGSASGFLPQE